MAMAPYSFDERCTKYRRYLAPTASAPRNTGVSLSFLVKYRTSNMPPKLKRILIRTALALLIAAGPVAFLDYFLPHHAVLRIVGAETRRPIGNSNSAKAQRDTFYISAEDVETQKPRVFRNEDTGWGFPFYFKFNSADLQAIAQSVAGERGTALFTYYGWRIQILSTTPNVTSIKRVATNAEPPLPWFNIIFTVAVLGGSAWLALWYRGVRNRRRQGREASARGAGINSDTRV
jgi:hypothetical protein